MQIFPLQYCPLIDEKIKNEIAYDYAELSGVLK